MNIELTDKEFRRLLDLVYVGNWILNSTRGSDRFDDYDKVQEKLFSLCPKSMRSLIDIWEGRVFPSKAYEEGGIHDAIADYEDAVFFDILAEELSRRDMSDEGISQDDVRDLSRRMNAYMSEFEKNGIENLTIEV